MPRWILVACALVVCTCVRAQITVDETATRAKLVNGVTTVAIAIRSSLSNPAEGRVDLEWLDPAGAAQTQGHTVTTIPSGNSSVDVTLGLPRQRDPLFLRLRYRLMPTAPKLTGFFYPAQGIVSFPQIAEHAFILTAAPIGTPRMGSNYEVRVFASHPISGKPVPGVAVEGAYNKTTTNADGAAILRLTPDAEERADPDTLEIRGSLGDLVQRIDANIPALPPGEIRIQTDKPLYQPGQTLHVRLLAIGSDKHAHAQASYSIHIRDGHETVVHAADVQTSRFGIASTDWEIPPNAAAGKYRIEVEGEDDVRARLQLEIRKYELPSFRVAVHPNRAFYLPGQNATLEVRADYLFGKPVQDGRVRIADADEDDKGESIQEGPLDANSRFHTTIDLSQAAKNLEAQNLFVDLHYTAYVTDSSTHRTEQRKFDLRISRAPIHIYLVRAGRSEAPRPIYVTTYTPDGKPAMCDVEVLRNGVKLGAGRSNRLGVARIDAALPEGEIAIRARDSAGALSEVTQSINGDAPRIRLDTDRVLYRAGQPVECDISAGHPDMPVTLLAWRDDRVLFSRTLRLKNGRAHVRIPYDPAFGRVLSLQVLAAAEEALRVGRTVLYPGPDDLRVAVHPGASSYKPGEQATLALRAETAVNIPVEAAFGISIVDQSVLERADTDRALVHPRWFDYSRDFEAKVAGIAWSDLINLDPKQIDGDLELVAESLQPDPVPPNTPDSFLDEQRSAFSDAVSKLLVTLRTVLDNHYFNTLKSPMNEVELSRILPWLPVLDPWQRPYRPKFSIEGANHVMRMISAGPDKQYDTEDDMEGLVVRREWFVAPKALIAEALESLTDFPGSVDAFYATLSGAGINLAAMRDPWGNALRPEIYHVVKNRCIKLTSPGPDHRFGTDDDVLVAQWQGNYFQERTNEIQNILDDEKEFPATEEAVYRVLRAAGLDLQAERDPWGHPFYLAISTDSRIRDRIQIYTYSDYPGTREQRKQVTQMTQKFLRIEIRSLGRDGVRDTYDDFSIAEFSRALDDNQPAPAPSASPRQPSATLGGTGTIAGVIADQSGAVIPNAEVFLNSIYLTKADSEGRYYFRGVRPGTYTLRFSSPGFQIHETANVPVRAEHVTRVDAVLSVGSVSERVAVSAELPMLQTNMAAVAFAAPAATATPRVREYFPETLYWQPELISGTDGHAHLNFRLADNITTWHVAVTASTADGHITEGETEVRAFQPFFVDLDPPQVLTAGDEVALPVPIRNYLATNESVAIEVSAPPSLAILDGAKRVEHIAASTSVSPAIRMRASSAPAVAKLRVTARAKKAADAIEKSITIHPDGEPMSQAVTDLLQNGRSLRIEIPANAIAGSIHAEVKFYPTLLANLIESMESILTRPYGCGEQTISSSYPNLLFLRALKKTGLKNERLEQRARHNLEKGYQRLLGYRSDGGGFSYWALTPPDAALTAYAIAFLEDASEFITVEESAISGAANWLLQQKAESVATSSLSLHALARTHQAQSSAALNEFLRQVPNMDDPYAVAQFALASMDANRLELVPSAIARLRALALPQQNMTYWPLVANTPYHGWGRAGVIETTAIAVTALSRWQKQSSGDPELKSLIDQGVLYLLRNKDASGLWMTSQATVRVFFALLDAFAGLDSGQPFTAVVSVNGAPAASVPVPGGQTIQGPVLVDVSRFIKPGAANEVSISAPREQSATQASFTAAWYQPWAGGRTSYDIAITARYSATESAANAPIQCDVEISRKKWKGYGMLIAEIGLPPGAEVDRGTLAELTSRYGVDSVEVAPDHVVFYVWPAYNGSKFRFTFHPRYAIHALSAPSALYDYYNPDARVVLPPQMFSVK